jgi:general secretion pathway protein A
MYQQFFGFRVMPFNITPDPRFLYLSPTHHDALSHLRYGLAQKAGFIVLTGEVGCGKTTLCRAFLNELDSTRVETALILNPRLTERELLAAILRELGEISDASAHGPLALDNADLTGRLNSALLRRIHAGKDIVLIIDEAQNLSFEVMEQLRLLSNLETDTQKLLQIILIGQPELKARLAERRLRQLRQRILVFYELRPLNYSQVQAYVQHRLTLALQVQNPASTSAPFILDPASTPNLDAPSANSSTANRKPKTVNFSATPSAPLPNFTLPALRAIARRSHGIPRLVNTLCDKALLAAYVRDSHQVTWADVRRAAKDQQQLES